MIQRTLQPDILDMALPKDIDSEMGVVGSMLLSPQVTDDVALLIDPSDFYDDANRRLYEAMLGEWEKGRKIDSTLLVSRLKKSGDFEAVGGSAYIAKVSVSVANAAHAKYYAKLVREKAVLRALIAAGTETVRDAFDDMAEPDDQLSAAEARVMAIRDSRRTTSLEVVKDILERGMKEIDKRHSGESCEFIATGYTDLDAILGGGLRPGNLAVLAARPGIGKSALASCITTSVATSGGAVLLVSLEMTKQEITERMLSACSQVSSHKMRTGTLSTSDRTTITQWASDVSLLPIWIEDATPLRVGDIGAHARRVSRQAEGGLRLIVVDYLQLVDPDNARDPRQEQVAKISRRLKSLAKERNCPVLALCQLNRQSETGDRKPKLWHLRESGAIEQDADVVMLLHRDDKTPEIGELNVAKQRNGAVKEIQLTWRKEYMRFDNAATDFHNRETVFDEYNNDGRNF